MKSKKDSIGKAVRNVCWGLIIPAAIIILWQILGTAGYINQSIAPVPSKLVEKAVELIVEGELQENLFASLRRVIIGYLAGSALGLLMGLLIGFSSVVDRLTFLLVGIFRPIPALAMIPIFIMVFGIGETSKIVIIMVGAFWPMLLNTIQGIRDVDPRLYELARVLEKNKWQTIIKVVMPSAFPSIFTGLRLGLSSSWTNIIAAEMIAAASGMGHMISFAREMSQPAVVFIGIFTIGLVGLLIDEVLKLVQKKVIYWC